MAAGGLACLVVVPEPLASVYLPLLGGLNCGRGAQNESSNGLDVAYLAMLL